MLVIDSWLVYERISLYLSVTGIGESSMTCRHIPSVIYRVPRVINWEKHTLAVTLENNLESEKYCMVFNFLGGAWKGLHILT